MEWEGKNLVKFQMKPEHWKKKTLQIEKDERSSRIASSSLSYFRVFITYYCTSCSCILLPSTSVISFRQLDVVHCVCTWDFWALPIHTLPYFSSNNMTVLQLTVGPPGFRNKFCVRSYSFLLPWRKFTVQTHTDRFKDICRYFMI
jgi:hypothetical protein